jgi:hypothetical protein
MIRCVTPLADILPYSCGATFNHGRSLTDHSDYDVKRPLRDVIGTLLELVLLPGQRDLIPRLTDMVSACRGVVEHRGKLWGELTEGASNIVATRVGVIAREILGTGRAAETGEQLH